MNEELRIVPWEQKTFPQASEDNLQTLLLVLSFAMVFLDLAVAAEFLQGIFTGVPMKFHASKFWNYLAMVFAGLWLVFLFLRAWNRCWYDWVPSAPVTLFCLGSTATALLVSLGSPIAVLSAITSCLCVAVFIGNLASTLLAGAEGGGAGLSESDMQ